MTWQSQRTRGITAAEFEELPPAYPVQYNNFSMELLFGDVTRNIVDDNSAENVHSQPNFPFPQRVLQRVYFQRHADYQEETIKGREQAFKLGHFDCVTDWFQVRQLWEAQPEENCPPRSTG
ncbi:unnamed protein product [Leuciscus chuanchicus]